MKKSLNKFFENYLKRESLFINKKVLQPYYIPDEVIDREKQIDEIAKILVPSLKLEKPSNLFVYGKTGAGKTCVVKYVTKQMQEFAENNRLKLRILYINCESKRVYTEYRLFAQIIRELGGEIPTSGLPTKEVYDFFVDMLEQERILLILILDKIDHLIKKQGDKVLRRLVETNSKLKQSKVSIVGITYVLVILNNMDQKARSILSEEEVLFPPYNAVELQGILKQRAKIGFKKGVLEEGLINKCAAYATRDYGGNVGRAIELLRVAGELADQKKHKKVLIKHLGAAKEKIDRDMLLEGTSIIPKQFQITLYSILYLHRKKSQIGKPFFTREVYEIYKNASKKCGCNTLTIGRVSKIITELDMLGLIQTKITSKGKGGRTKEICVDYPQTTIKEINRILKQGLQI